MTPPGDTVYIYKINCESAPSSVNANNVANGSLPVGCQYASAGVTFGVTTNTGQDYGNYSTDGGGEIVIFVPNDVTSIYLDEDITTNQNGDVIDPGHISSPDLHSCPCRHTNRVVINIVTS